MKLKIGQKAPDFKLKDQKGYFHKLSNYRGKWVLIYFYPKDDTPGCTQEACQIRENFDDFKKLKTVVLGISNDSVESHKKFAKKYQLNFPLLADEKKEVVKKYGVWRKRKFLGKEIKGIQRTSFLINPQGFIFKIYEKVNPEKHAQEVIADLKDLSKK